MWGKGRCRKARYKCKDCGRTFSKPKTNKVKVAHLFSLFKSFVSSGTPINAIFGKGYSDKTLSRYFHAFLDDPPRPLVPTHPTEINLKVDGKYFKHGGCSLVFKVGTSVFFWDFVERESYVNYVLNFERLKRDGYVVRSVTSDKHGSTIAAVKTAFPTIPHQYCVIHIQRRCKTLLTRHPETSAGRDLLALVNVIHQIDTLNDKRVFLMWFERYKAKYEATLNKRTYSTDPASKKKWWYTHKNVRKAFIHLKSSLPNMFFYLEDPAIPRHTNGLEGEFTHLETKLNMHRGLSRVRRKGFTFWYWYFQSIKGK